jgi:hypothetical protein
VIQGVGVGYLEFAADASEAEVAGAEDEAREAGGDEGSGAHHAGLERAVEGRAGEAVVAEVGGGFADGQDLGVGGGVVAGDGRVPAAADDLAIDDDDGSDGDFTRAFTAAGEVECFSHESVVVDHSPIIGKLRDMAELEIHHETHAPDPTGQKVGVLAAMLAVALAIVTIASHRTHTAAIMHKSTANDEWSHYQSTRVKFHNLELGENLLQVLDAKNPAAEKMRESYAGQKVKYEAQAKEIQETARRSDEAAEGDEHRALRYDIGEGLLEIGLVLTSLYFISKKKMFPVLGMTAAVLGAVVAIAGLLA